MGSIKHISTQWLVKMWEYIMDNPQFIVNNFVRSGICRALDGATSDDELDDLLEKMDSASDTSETSSLSNDEIDYQSSEANDESITGVTNEATPIVLYSSSSDKLSD